MTMAWRIGGIGSIGIKIQVQEVRLIRESNPNPIP